ncbi:hypothetical protein CIB48_g8907 [Xylaria polymorpha]|nr:hypothetical protein CIB48_g8907 [Xylaria polymorpha]
MSTKLQLGTEVWKNTVSEFNPGQRGNLCYSQAISISALLLQVIESVWEADGYELHQSQSEHYNNLVQWKEWAVQHGKKAALEKDWAVSSVLEKEGGHRILLLSSQLKHVPKFLNVLEIYLVLCTIRHLNSYPNFKDDFKVLEMKILPEVKLTTASFKEGIQEILESLAEATLERVDLRKTVETASWSASFRYLASLGRLIESLKPKDLEKRRCLDLDEICSATDDG